MQALEAEAEMGEDDRDTKARTGGDRSREGQSEDWQVGEDEKQEGHGERQAEMQNRRERRNDSVPQRKGSQKRRKREETEQPERPRERRDARRCGE